VSASRPTKEPRSLLRGVLFRLVLAVGAPLLLVLALEGLSLAIWGRVEYPLPGVDEAARYLYFNMPERINPLFRLDEASVDGDDGVFEAGLDTTRQYLVRVQRFPARRTPDAVRLAFIGGSSVQGWPYRAAGTSFPEVVGELLSERFPRRRFDVINAGVGGYSSFQFADVAAQLEVFDPDVVVVYAGHNDQGYYLFHEALLDSLQADPLATVRHVERAANRFNFFRVLRRVRDRGAPAPELFGEVAEPEATDPVFWPDAETQAASDPERFASFVQAHQTLVPAILARNLGDLVDQLRDEHTQVVLAVPASNLRDHAPTLSLHMAPVDGDGQMRFTTLLEEARSEMKAAGVHPRSMPGIGGNGELMRFDEPIDVAWEGEHLAVGSAEAVTACANILPMIDEAIAISPSWAEAWYLRGTCLLHSDPAAALSSFVRARDLCPAMPPHQRAWSGVEEAVRLVGAGRNVPVVDVPGWLAAHAEQGVPGGELFVDNLHLSGAGAQLTAEAVVDTLARLPAVRRGPARDRPPDLGARQAARELERVAGEFHWGMGIDVPGAGQAKVGPSANEAPTARCDEGAIRGTIPVLDFDPLHGVVGVDGVGYRLRVTSGTDIRITVENEVDGADLVAWLLRPTGELLAGPGVDGLPRAFLDEDSPCLHWPPGVEPTPLNRPFCPEAAWTSPWNDELVLMLAARSTDSAEAGFALCLDGADVLETLPAFEGPAVFVGPPAP
jgi:lysophospholipase L1-like esterase